MPENEQILFMQLRLIKMAEKRWNKPISEVIDIFKGHKLAELIERCFYIYHMEGDEAVYADIMEHLVLQDGEIV